jgi:phosphoribosyl-ATP pyrophosphohydrolase/phosphoribosyl-AMP cyclohydrolase
VGDDVKWNEAGLAPVVVVDCLTGEVRMLAWANAEALAKTRATGRATFFSRSRGALWEKGETSGRGLDVVRVRIDCDADALVYEVEPHGPTCHTGAESCFYRDLGGKPAPREPLLVALGDVLEARKAESAHKSYTKSLYEGGVARVSAKIREEADELARALEGETHDRVAAESADLLFHVMVGLHARGLSLRDALAVLSVRFGTGGHEEKESRGRSR